MHVMYSIVFTAADVASKILTFPKANYLKYQVMAKLLNQVIGKCFQVSNYLITTIPKEMASLWMYKWLTPAGVIGKWLDRVN